MRQKLVGNPADPAWVQLCSGLNLDPVRRMAGRLAVLGDAQALDGTLFRADELDDEAEEELGDVRILFAGPFQAPQDWTKAVRSAFFDGLDPQLFVLAYIECLAPPSSPAFFVADLDDYLAAMTASGEVVMYFVHDCKEDEQGRLCVLIRDDQPLF